MVKRSLQLQQRSCDPRLLSTDTDLHPLLQRVFSARAIGSFDETRYPLSALLAPARLSHIEAAAALLAEQIQQQSPILVFGDYDADGATSTALCLRALRMLGHQRIDYLLPDRLKDGYGVSASAAQRIIELAPRLVITVDTGIASFSGLQLLAEAGIDVIITDHHLPADQLPPATAIVNPNAFADSAGKNLAGVGVAFYLMLALRSQLRDQGWFSERAEPNLAECLDLVAIGSIADLVPLDFNNRILVSEGLKRIRAGLCSRGISKLIELAGRRQQTLSSQDIAFSVAPRINAAGRLDDMSIGVQALLAQDDSSAHALALQLDEINRNRRVLQGEMTEQAMAMLAELELEHDQHSYVLYQPDWHEGIVGIIASKVKDLTFRPSIGFAPAEQGQLKGSCRSIPGIHIRDMLDLVDKAEPDLIIRFGGHAMAAGLTIRQAQLARFRECFERILVEHVDAACFDQVIEHDGEIDADDLDLPLAQLIQQAGPWGQRFPVPSFYGEFRVLQQRIVGECHLKWVLSPLGSRRRIDAILFYASEQQLASEYQQLKIHYELGINDYQGVQDLQLLVRHII